MTIYDYASVPTSAEDYPAQIDALRADGFEVYAEAPAEGDRPGATGGGGLWYLKRERTPAEVLETVVGTRAAEALVAAGIDSLEAAQQASAEGDLEAVHGVGQATTKKLKAAK